MRGAQEVMKFHDQSDGEGPIYVDGIFGPQTDHWVRGVQNAVDIDVDGIIGPVTWRAMVSGILSGCPQKSFNLAIWSRFGCCSGQRPTSPSRPASESTTSR